MNCHYCAHSPTKAHPYDLSGVRQRVIPTFTHSQIFNYDSYNNPRVRCTPTFHSTALDVQGYQVVANHTIRKQTLKGTCSGANGCKVGCMHSQKEEGTVYGGKLWYDSAKQELFKSLVCCPTNYSRERKQADLSSNPVFGGCVMQPCCYKVVESQPCAQLEQKPVIEQHRETVPAPAMDHRGHYDAREEKQSGEWAMWEAEIERQRLEKQQQNEITFGKPGAQTNANKQEKANLQTATQTGGQIQKQTKEVRPKSAAVNKKKTGQRLQKTVVVGKPSFTIVRNRQ